MADIFLSYNREDQPTAKKIAAALQGEGFDVWWDTVLRAGQTYDEVTEKQLYDASAVVVLWSSRSVRSKWVRAEATLGDRKSALIPVMIEQCDRPIMFELIQTADLTKWQGDTADPQWRAFVDDVRENVKRKRSAQTPSPVAAVAFAAGATAHVADDTIEAAFWMSIQDGEDPSDFEAYLERYPKGHFATLARKRLTALTTPKIVVSPPPPPKVEPVVASPEPVAPVSPPPVAPVVPPRVDAFQAKAAAQPSKPRLANKPAAKGRSPMPLILAGVLVAGLAATAFVLWPKPAGDPPATEVAEPAPAEAVPTPVVEEPIATTASAPADPPSPAPTAATFRDCDGCPEMKRLEGGKFLMGSPSSEAGHRAWEGPQREVTIAPLAVSIREVTFAEWEACVADGGCGTYTPTDKGWGRGTRPVIMVSWSEAEGYARWLSKKTGKTYRLPTEAEWEYAARGGTTTAYWWGDKFESGRAPSGKTAETASGEANPFGLHDVTGNVAEWVEDCYVNSFANAPTNGAAVVASGCQRVIRGGGWRANAGDLRIANRSRLAPGTRDTAIGFRVVATE